MPSELFYQIALTRIPSIGDVIIKKLIEHFGSAEAVFKARRFELEKVMNIGSMRIAALRSFKDFGRVEEEMRFLEKYKITPLFCTDPAYPRKLLDCYDTPAMLYFRGNTPLNAKRMVGIVGTRRPSAYGSALTVQLVTGLADAGVTIVSGLAYGIDVIAHKTALQSAVPTIGVLAHGLDRIYPPAHKNIAAEMTERGGLLTDYISGTLPDKQNFPRRNRIVAGLCDVTIVVESGLKGGSLITADLANGYNRDVCAVPGRVDDPLSAGCNWLIKQNKAALINGVEDVLSLMGWQTSQQINKKQYSLFPELTQDEEALLAILQEKSPRHVEEFYGATQLSGSEIAQSLFTLEMQQVIRRLPGEMYEVC
ncbi:DNA processing protein [Chitinophaga terrae (ex Kim and Jung 2007)]|uniref:DNA processing protein n=1 Tax=Chitinophaga terrae (ex Kim and Jung 2007) TaxID=408074 RepID=A0A1H4DD85_9BACT|nr:DNA-processing protein DprA [Chitinophaga terrae (ex Kim and Jung 2007)]MDQ0107761.1 DNA processing protein [Chitinophaga terrae (ex Kim and Jung 2007)]GEP92578.1 DNA processing protein DprA [Chitinophaga terrae (ex Kim and Jung 2007)]SEA70359.1 DNA processing protein [Chitinophaga terrae (ex Kim and Jung 2007)]